MTREEKQKAIDALTISAPVRVMTPEEFNDYIQTINQIIDWLEQEPILDKIRAEIKELDIFYDNDYFSSNKDAMFKCNDVLQILDKYKAEMEAEDGKNENVLVGCIGCKYSGVPKHAVCNSCINMNRYEQEVIEDGKTSVERVGFDG